LDDCTWYQHKEDSNGSVNKVFNTEHIQSLLSHQRLHDDYRVEYEFEDVDLLQGDERVTLCVVDY